MASSQTLLLAAKQHAPQIAERKGIEEDKSWRREIIRRQHESTCGRRVGSSDIGRHQRGKHRAARALRDAYRTHHAAQASRRVRLCYLGAAMASGIMARVNQARRIIAAAGENQASNAAAAAGDAARQ